MEGDIRTNCTRPGGPPTIKCSKGWVVGYVGWGGVVRCVFVCVCAPQPQSRLRAPPRARLRAPPRPSPAPAPGPAPCPSSRPGYVLRSMDWSSGYRSSLVRPMVGGRFCDGGRAQVAAAVGARGPGPRAPGPWSVPRASSTRALGLHGPEPGPGPRALARAPVAARILRGPPKTTSRSTHRHRRCRSRSSRGRRRR